MKNYYYILLIILFCLLSCKEKTKKYYYDSGELRTEEFLINGNDSIAYVKKYYKSGTLIEEGILKYDSIMDGHWKIYYADGELMWKGEIKNNVIQDKYKWKWEECVADRLKGIEIEGNSKELVVGNTYKFRVIMPEIHPQFYQIVNINYQNIHDSTETDFYPYRFTCTEQNGNLLKIVFMNKEGHFVIGNPEYDFLITPSKENNITKFNELEVGDTVSVKVERKFSDGSTDTVVVYR